MSMGEWILKFLRISFFYALYFIACMFVTTIFFKSWADGAQMAFAFFVPGLLVWWHEHRRSSKLVDGAQNSEARKQHRNRPVDTRDNAELIRVAKAARPALEAAAARRRKEQSATGGKLQGRRKSQGQGWVPKGQ